MAQTDNTWLHRFALLLAGATFILVIAGASVTSTGSGLAVPDWPLSFGTLFPPMVGGVLYEHGHRMIAGVVLVLTTVLTVWLFRREKRAWVRKLGLVALISVVLQAILGGLTVLLRLPTLTSVSHAGLAMAFFCLTVSMVLFTSRGWRTSGPGEATSASLVPRLALVTTVVIYVQILLGAVMRHTGAGLAIPDFPLAYGRLLPPYWSSPIVIHYAHRVGAFVVSALVIWLVVRVLRRHRTEPMLTRPALLLAGVVILQLLLGALTIWTRRAVTPTTVHVAIGAAVLAVSLVLTLRSYRLLPVTAKTSSGLVEDDVGHGSPVASMGR